jgi:hypothetical protein
MTFADEGGTQPQEKDVHDELKAFLDATDKLGPKEEEEEGYESDGGTQYVKDPRTGYWIHEALAASRTEASTLSETKKRQPEAVLTTNLTKKRKKKPKFSAKNAKLWIYVSGLPHDTDEEEVAKVFSKVGIIELDPDTQHPKIKLYRYKDGPQKGQVKGDASICYARPESVDLALQILDEAQFRPSVTDSQSNIMKVECAKFEQHGDQYDEKKHAKVSSAKRKVAKLAALQAVDWDESENGRITGGRKGLCIIVLKHMFTLEEISRDEDAVLAALEKEVLTECEQWGTVEKITVFSKNPEGVVVVRFTQPTAASTAIDEYNGRSRNGRKVEAAFWDGVTDYTVVDEEKEKKEEQERQEEFGNWLESQELPSEFRLQVEGESTK